MSSSLLGKPAAEHEELLALAASKTTHGSMTKYYVPLGDGEEGDEVIAIWVQGGEIICLMKDSITR
jgi:hypothetical protein